MIIRANQLRKGDSFVKLGREYKVINRSDIIMYNLGSSTGVTKNGRGSFTMGAKSQEKVELVSRICIKKSPSRRRKGVMVRVYAGHFAPNDVQIWNNGKKLINH